MPWKIKDSLIIRMTLAEAEGSRQKLPKWPSDRSRKLITCIVLIEKQPSGLIGFHKPHGASWWSLHERSPNRRTGSGTA